MQSDGFTAPFPRYVRNWLFASWVIFFLDEKIHSGLAFICELMFTKNIRRIEVTQHLIPSKFCLQEGLRFNNTLNRKQTSSSHQQKTCQSNLSPTPWHVSKTILTLRCTLGRIHRMCPCHLMWSHSALWFLHVKRPSNGNKLVCSSTWPGEACRVCESMCVWCVLFKNHRKGVNPSTTRLRQKTCVLKSDRDVQYYVSPKHVFFIVLWFILWSKKSLWHIRHRFRYSGHEVL